ncbi:hypothetical protein [Spiroplasma melliferum]|uniref:Uncharacterized protein n=2 Tax=Spiroplasma melliferum TaxID=2134 RepID=A0AAI9X0K9_SPIME|nr:hypothetical protein [Spiroplasma melliferum]KAI92291.1 hypothetical protein SPM_006155 [Spiroplasma melliferum KC3]QCO23723.1 hypothetical protein SRED_002197 [Spiroplasma melliferum]
MKKLLIALTTPILALTGITSLILSEQQASVVENKKINWYEIKTNLTENSIKDIVLTQGLNNDKVQEALDNPAMLKKAREKSLEYINHFEKQKINTLEDVTNYLKNNIQEFKDNFKVENKLGNLNNVGLLSKTAYAMTPNDSVQATPNKTLDKEQAINNTEETIKKLKILDTTLLTIAVISDIAAAGFWAASWFFGISVPWAVAATSLAAALHVIQNAVHVFLVNNKTLESTNWWGIITWAKDITFFASSVSYSLIYNTAVSIAEAAVTATSWAVPAAFAGIGVFSTMYAWIKLYIDSII